MFRVSELVAGVRKLLEHRVGAIWVSGEVSNVHRAASGHVYLTLKDEGAQLRAALYRREARSLRFELEDGLEVLAHGELTVFEPRGELQMRLRALEPRGRGALQLAFEQLRARLEAEGLFDPARKRELPLLPRSLGVVTSPQGAAVRDVIRVARERFPAVPIVVAPTRVQGEGAEYEIAAALGAIARVPEVDVVLLVRGGGSLEDLWSFNSEVVARAVRACPRPVVAGVGHEVDVSIADLAADARAATPSAAAALALPDRNALATRLGRDLRRLVRAGERHTERAAERLDRVAARLVANRRFSERARARVERLGERLRAAAPAARLTRQRERLAQLERALVRGIEARIVSARAGLAGSLGRLDALSPLAVLARGYAIVRRPADGRILRAAGEARPGERLLARLADGELEVEAIAAREPPDEA